MKTPLYTLIVACLMLAVQSLRAADEIIIDMDDQRERMPVVFADAPLPQSSRTMIIEDLTQIVQALPSTRITKLQAPLTIDGHQGLVTITHRVALGRGKKHYPNTIEATFGLLNHADDAYTWVIPKELSAAYLEVVQAADSEAELLQRRKELLHFLATINSNTQIDETLSDPKKTKSFFYFYQMPPWSRLSVYEKNLKAVKALTYCYPGLLALERLPASDQGDELLLFFSPVILSTQNPDYADTFPPFVHDGHAWHFLVARLP